MFYMFVLHFYALYFGLCCDVHTIFMIKCLLNLLCISLDSMEYKYCRNNNVSLILKHHMIMCFYTLP